MENVQLTLASGYIITFKPYLSHGQKRTLTKFLSSKMSIDPTTGKTNTNIDGSVIMEGQDMTMKLMLVSIQLPDGTTVTGDQAFNVIQEMRDSDGEAVYKKLDELTNPQTEEDKKKLNLPSLNSSNQDQA